MAHPTSWTHDRESFHRFFESWLVEQDRYLHDLVSASRSGCTNTSSSSSGGEGSEGMLRPLVDTVLSHYEHYYRAKSQWVKHDALAMLSPCWRTTLEEAFLWIGGWRPSMAFHLLYSKSGLQLEAALPEILRGITTGDLGDLSPLQLGRVDALQRSTIRAEQEITERMAKQQEAVADAAMVELSHMASTEMLRNGEARREEEQVESALAHKKEGMEEILERADDLRLRTLKEVIDILTPIQAVHFLIAAAELHLRLHEWGLKRDAGLTHPHPLPEHQTHHNR